MSTNNNGNGQDPCGKDKDILCECKTAMIDEVTLLEGVADAAVTTKDSKVETRDNKVCCVLKAEETSTIYRNIDYYVAIDANCRTEQIEKKVDDLTKKSDDLNKAIQEAVKCIKNIKSKTSELKAKACDLDTEIKDSCNKQQLGILNKHFKTKCQARKPDGNGENDCFEDFEAIASYIKEQTGLIWEKADKSFNDAVSISGIQTFSNVKSLKELSKTVAVCAKDFKKNIDDNIKSSADELKKAQDELATCVKEVSTKTMEEHAATTLYEGNAFALDFICWPDCDNEEDISELCCKVMETLCSDIECGDPKESKKEYDYKKKNID